MNGVTFLAGFITGGLTVFIGTAVAVWKPRLDELTMRAIHERDRRIEAEDGHQAQLDDDVRIIGEWPGPMDFVNKKDWP